MYRDYFGLKENPFTIAPDPHYFYMSEGHREALAHLLYGVNSDSGFVLLSGEVGTGKTLLCRCLIGQIPENTDIAFILNPKLNVDELLASVCDEFGVGYPAGNTSNKVFVAAIYDYLFETHKKGRRAILIIEEAQNLSEDVLEQIRLLTNLETNQRKLLQIILLGQPELLDVLKRPRMRQLSQRITARYHLGPLLARDIAPYVEHRLSVAGWMRGRLFPDDVLKLLYRHSGGIPRLINMICDRALIGAFAQGKALVDRETLLVAVREVSGENVNRKRRWHLYGGIAAGCLLAICVALALMFVMPRFHAAQAEKHAAFVPHIDTVTIPNIVPEEPPDEITSLTLVGKDASRTMTKAYQSLFRAWEVRFDTRDERSVDEQARRRGLRLLAHKGSLVNLKLMNRPVMLTLTDAQSGENFYVTMISLLSDRAEIAIGDEIRTVNIQDLFLLWTGEFRFLWRLPTAYQSDLRPGNSGPMAEWVNRQMAAAMKRPELPLPAWRYSGRLVEDVREFQLMADLPADGIVGPMTIAYLSGAAGLGGPRLSRREQE
ncbi:MAG: AAA family ATPase [Smithellaceae bacterium]